MTKAEAKRLRKEWHDLSMVCYCRPNQLCRYCRQQDEIKAKVEAAGWNIFTLEKKP